MSIFIIDTVLLTIYFIEDNIILVKSAVTFFNSRLEKYRNNLHKHFFYPINDTHLRDTQTQISKMNRQSHDQKR